MTEIPQGEQPCNDFFALCASAKRHKEALDALTPKGETE